MTSGGSDFYFIMSGGIVGKPSAWFTGVLCLSPDKSRIALADYVSKAVVAGGFSLISNTVILIIAYTTTAISGSQQLRLGLHS